MRDELLGHLLGALEPRERERLEARLREDPNLCGELETLRRGLDVLDGDPGHCEPPPGLALAIVAICAAPAAAATTANANPTGNGCTASALVIAEAVFTIALPIATA